MTARTSLNLRCSHGDPGSPQAPLWVGFAALVGGSGFVHEDGVDFTLVSPVLLAVALFVLLPGVAAALVVLLVELEK